jgi:hypothetical protein
MGWAGVHKCEAMAFIRWPVYQDLFGGVARSVLNRVGTYGHAFFEYVGLRYNSMAGFACGLSTGLDCAYPRGNGKQNNPVDSHEFIRPVLVKETG